MKLRTDLAERGSLIELDEWSEDLELKARAEACVAAQRSCAVDAADAIPAEFDDAHAAVAPAALKALIAARRNVHGISREHEISNVLAFNAAHLKHSRSDRGSARARTKLDAHVNRKLRDLFPDQRTQAFGSGYFWYPPGAYMGWHTNSEAPGWRLYVTRSDEPGRSFFRYRDPASAEIVTASDAEWNFRLFCIEQEKPFWHAVYSETDRFSFGYVILDGSFASRLRRLRDRRLPSLRRG